AEPLGRAQQEDLAAARLKLEKRAPHGVEPLLEIDDPVRALGPVRGRVRERGLACGRIRPSETVADEIRRDLEQIRAGARGRPVERLHAEEPGVRLLQHVLGVRAPAEKTRDVAQQRAPVPLEEMLYEARVLELG